MTIDMDGFKTLWRKRKFRGQQGYMLSTETDTKLFMVPQYNYGKVLLGIKTALMLGSGRKIERTYEYHVQHDPDREKKTLQENLQAAGNRALIDALTYLRDQEAVYAKRADDIEETLKRHQKNNQNRREHLSL